jgi:hypothetical protein
MMREEKKIRQQRLSVVDAQCVRWVLDCPFA